MGAGRDRQPLSGWTWLSLAGVLLLAELVTPGFAFLWLAMSAGLTGLMLLVWPTLPWQAQVLTLAALTVASVAAWFRLRRCASDEDGGPARTITLNRRTASLVGQTAHVVEPTGAAGIRGRVGVGDTGWLAEGSAIPKGAAVRVVGAAGSVLRIDPIAPADADEGSPPAV